MDIINEWLQSQLPALLRGARLVPKTETEDSTEPYYEEGEQGTALYLVQPNNQREWILKKFHSKKEPDYDYLVAIRSLVPRSISCWAATKRIVMGPNDIKTAEGFFCTPDFVNWIENSIFMPKVPGVSWQEMIAKVRKGERELSLAHRKSYAKSLAQTIEDLENNGCAHRDLSHENVFLDTREYITYIVDWDSLFHGSLYFHKNTTTGTEGYIAPWTQNKESEKWDPRKSWHRNADRFALAILVAEFFMVENESPTYTGGNLFSQNSLSTPTHSHITKTCERLTKISPDLGELFHSTMTATSYEGCPSPVKWVETIEAIDLEVAQQNLAYRPPTPVDETEQVYEEDDEGFPEEDPEEFEEFEEEEILVSSQSFPKPVASKRVRSVKESSPTNKILLALIVLLPLLFMSIHYWKSQETVPEEDNSGNGGTELGINSIGEPNSGTPAISGNSGNNSSDYEPKRYYVNVLYSDIDLKMSINNKRVKLARNNSAVIRIKPGTYSVSLTFTGTIFAEDGLRYKKTKPLTKTKTVTFGDNSNVAIQIDRMKQTWQVK